MMWVKTAQAKVLPLCHCLALAVDCAQAIARITILYDCSKEKQERFDLGSFSLGFKHNKKADISKKDGCLVHTENKLIEL